MTDEDIAQLNQVCDGHPGAVRVAMELRYDEEHPEAWPRLLELGITGTDLYVLYKSCCDSAAAVICRISDGTAVPLLKVNPESTFFGKP